MPKKQAIIVRYIIQYVPDQDLFFIEKYQSVIFLEMEE